jgi:hypothetical protein
LTQKSQKHHPPGQMRTANEAGGGASLAKLFSQQLPQTTNQTKLDNGQVPPIIEENLINDNQIKVNDFVLFYFIFWLIHNHHHHQLNNQLFYVCLYVTYT